MIKDPNSKALMQIVQELYSSVEVKPSLLEKVKRDILGDHPFEAAATQVVTNLSRMVMGNITQLKEAILASNPNDLELKTSIDQITQESERGALSPFQVFLELTKLAPPDLRPKIAPLSNPTHSFVHITEDMLFFNLASKLHAKAAPKLSHVRVRRVRFAPRTTHE